MLKRELIVGGTGTGGNAHFYPKVLNAVLGTKFKIVPGYPGSAEVLLAMERGETEGFCSMGFVTLEYTRPDWVRDKKVNQLVQLGITKNKNHLDVPLALDLAKTEADKQAIEFVVSPNLFARPFTGAAGRAGRARAALRKAFNATFDDPDYLAEAEATEDAGAAGRGRGDRRRAQAHLQHAALGHGPRQGRHQVRLARAPQQKPATKTVALTDNARRGLQWTLNCPKSCGS